MSSPILLRNSFPFDLDLELKIGIGPASTPDIAIGQSYHHHHDKKNNNSNNNKHEKDEDYHVNEEMRNWGWLLLVTSSISFVIGFWSIAISPFIITDHVPVSLSLSLNIHFSLSPYSIHHRLTTILQQILHLIANDHHYKYLFIFIIPVALYAAIINWWGFKIHRSH
jgi:hypothetical protein